MSDKLDQIVGAGHCHGCGGCVAVTSSGKLSMQMTPAGYLRPAAQSPLTGEEQRRVAAVCSGHAITQTPGADYDPIWGRLLSVRVGHAADEAVRRAGSSGGVLSSLLLHLLDSGAIDGVWHTIADPNDPFGNVSQLSRTREQVLAATGSRYAPSAPLAELRRALSESGRLAFVGKPCDVASLRRIAMIDQRFAEKFPILLSFMCAGLPSRRGVLKVVEAMGGRPEDVDSFSFRGDGWPGYARAAMRDGSTLRMSYNDSWGNILSRHLQYRCKICPDGIGEFADVVCADAWFGKDGYPDFTERPGRSLILARTPRGEQILSEAIASGCVAAEPIGVEVIRGMQPYQHHRRCSIAPRLAAICCLGGRAPRYRNMMLMRAMRMGGWKSAAKSFAGTVRRILWGRMRRD